VAVLGASFAARMAGVLANAQFHHSDTALSARAQTRHHLFNYVLHTALYLPLLLIWASLTPHFAATFVMFRIILRPEFRQQIFSGHLGEATIARLLGFIG